MKADSENRPGRLDDARDELYFDDEATVLARPVVPLEAVDGDETQAAPDNAAAQHASSMIKANDVAPSVSNRTTGGRPRNHEPAGHGGRIPLALILIAVLVGVAIGGGGFYIFQRQHGAETAPADEQLAAPAQAEPQPAPPVTQQAAESAPTEENGPPAETAENSEPKESQTASQTEESDAAPKPARNAARDSTPSTPSTASPAPARDQPARTVPAGARTEGETKRGKRGDGEDDNSRRRNRRGGDDDDSEARPARQQTRRVDTITYPRNRRDNQRSERRPRGEPREVDSVRGIFEGRP